MPKPPPAPSEDNPLTRALSRWEDEGGSAAPTWEERAAEIEDEERILRCLGAAVIALWNKLPVETQRELFKCASAAPPPPANTRLKEQIARFLHGHKDLAAGGRGKARAAVH